MYGLVFLVGVLAGRGRSESKGQDEVSEMLLAGRSLPLWVGLLTMTATWVGGGYINGTAEYTYSAGLLWGAQAGVGYALSLILGGLFFARRMRAMNYTTLVDPLESRYGKGVAATLMVPAVLAETFWSAAILVALGTTFDAVIGLENLTVAILVSATVAIAYTVGGGLRAVAYTDVIQLFLILVGLGLALPFVIDAAGGAAVLMQPAADGVDPLAWFGSMRETVAYSDFFILLMLGGIPWNVYFQRVLSARTPEHARYLSLAAGVLCALMAIPPILFGLAARHIDWVALGATTAGMALGGPDVITANLAENPAFVMPYTLRLAVPLWISVLGLGAIAAAVMSSVDSSILSASSLVAWNGYRRLINPAATAEQVTKMVRILVVALGSFATVVALKVQSVAALWYLCGDVVYTVLFPQLTLALFDSKANRSGALAGLAVSVFMRLGGGDGTLGLPAFLPYPDWQPTGDFPFRTLAMLCGLLTAIVVSRLTAASDPAKPLAPLEG
ncbi:MAG: sodium:solute symporter family protein [Proteobacteria bacterium]|nr:sodium:solute symporter family protein [Pseudomonadota bacterium]